MTDPILPVHLIRLHFRVKLSGLGELVLEPIRGEVFGEVGKDDAISRHVDYGGLITLPVPFGASVKDGDVVCIEVAKLPCFKPMSFISDDSFMN